MANNASKFYVAWRGLEQLELLELVEANTVVLRATALFSSN